MTNYTLEEIRQKITTFLDEEIISKDEFKEPQSMPRWKRWAFLYFANGGRWRVTGWGFMSSRAGHQIGIESNQAYELMQIDAMITGWMLLIPADSWGDILRVRLDRYVEAHDGLREFRDHAEAQELNVAGVEEA